jgi:hypothetical protein
MNIHNTSLACAVGTEESKWKSVKVSLTTIPPLTRTVTNKQHHTLWGMAEMNNSLKT